MQKTNQDFVVIETQVSEAKVISIALSILSRRFNSKETLTSPQDVKDYLSLKIGGKSFELFCCIYLDNKNQIIGFEELFRGTIDQVTVHPREVVQRCLHHQASALIVAHNHPSGVCEPSKADEEITSRLKDVLTLVDVRLLDHIIVGGSKCISLAERGCL